MKIIEALKLVKLNKTKIADLQNKIAQNCAMLSHETPVYPSVDEVVQGWVQACLDLAQENIKLLVQIQKTNVATPVTIELGGKTVTKSIAEWVWRRREYAALDMQTVTKLTDRGLKEAVIQPTVAGNEPTKITIVRYYDPVKRDALLATYRTEPYLIDSTLEIVNATTDLID